MSYKRSIIEGVTSGNTNTKKNINDESNADTEMKSMIKNMNKYLSKNVEPKINKLLEKIKNTSDEINNGIVEKNKNDINTFSEKNKEATKVSSQKKVPPFPDNEITNLI
jgi:membrane-anchored protein YejM (alkaline phosphatase superfamily)